MLNDSMLAEALLEAQKQYALLENNIKPPELKDGYFNTDYLKELVEQD